MANTKKTTEKVNQDTSSQDLSKILEMMKSLQDTIDSLKVENERIKKDFEEEKARIEKEKKNRFK